MWREKTNQQASKQTNKRINKQTSDQTNKQTSKQTCKKLWKFSHAATDFLQRKNVRAGVLNGGCVEDRTTKRRLTDFSPPAIRSFRCSLVKNFEHELPQTINFVNLAPSSQIESFEFSHWWEKVFKKKKKTRSEKFLRCLDDILQHYNYGYYTVTGD